MPCLSENRRSQPSLALNLISIRPVILSTADYVRTPPTSMPHQLRCMYHFIAASSLLSCSADFACSTFCIIATDF